MESLLETFQQQYSQILGENQSAPLLVLLGLSFFGGLASSLLPCVLSLLPINLAYIGTLNIKSKVEAFQKAALFVAGVSTVLTALGLSASFAFAVFTEYKGLINLIVGLVVVTMALSLAGVFKLPMPQAFSKMPEANPYVVGVVFALVSSPCSSPVLVSMVTVAGNQGSLLASLIIMLGFSLGYTAIIFFASLFTGLAKQLDWFKENSDLVIKISAAMLALMGAFYIYIGISSL